MSLISALILELKAFPSANPIAPNPGIGLVKVNTTQPRIGAISFFRSFVVEIVEIDLIINAVNGFLF